MVNQTFLGILLQGRIALVQGSSTLLQALKSGVAEMTVPKIFGSLVGGVFAALILAGCGQNNESSQPSGAVAPAEQPAAAPNGALRKGEVNYALSLIGTPTYLAQSDSLLLRFKIDNFGPKTLSPEGAYPVKLGVELLGPDGNPDKPPGNRDLLRVAIPVISPGGSAEVEAKLPLEGIAGHKLQVQMMQELVVWFGDKFGQPSLWLGPFQHCAGEQAEVCDEKGTQIPSG